MKTIRETAKHRMREYEYVAIDIVNKCEWINQNESVRIQEKQRHLDAECVRG